MTAHLVALKLRFLARCSSDLAVLQRHMRAPGTVFVTDLETLVHQMAGAAAAFGFPRLSDLALGLDNQFSAGDPPSDKQMQALIDELNLCIEK